MQGKRRAPQTLFMGETESLSLERLIWKMEMRILTPFVILSAFMTATWHDPKERFRTNGENPLKLTYPLKDFRTENIFFAEC